MEDDRPLRIWVHPMLIDEFRIRKEILEKKTGYAVNGGIPIISKVCALELRKLRTGDKNNIKLEVHKIKGMKKNEIMFL